MESQVIYIGPNVSTLGLMRYQVYLNGLPSEVQAAIAKFPEVEKLIVPVEELTVSLQKLNTPGEELYEALESFKRKAGVK